MISPHDELLLQKFLNDQLNEIELSNIQLRLCKEPELADCLVQLTEEEIDLQAWGASREVAKYGSSFEKRSFVGRHPFSILFSVSVLAVAFICLGIVFRKGGSVDSSGVQLVAQHEAKWKNEPSNSTQLILQEKEKYLLSGTIQLQFPTGAQALIKGPATFKITGKNRLYLKQGILLAEVRTEEAKGFTVETPTSKNIDHGTVFGVVVNHGGESIMQVFQGKVESRHAFGSSSGSHTFLTKNNRISHKRDGTSSRNVRDFSQQFGAVFGNSQRNDTAGSHPAIPNSVAAKNSGSGNSEAAAHSKGRSGFMLNRIKNLVGVQSVPAITQARKQRQQLYSLVAAEKLEDRALLSGTLAFPGAEGFGANATGGRGGDVYHVTSLADYGSGEAAIVGSLRHAIASASGARTIVFDTGGEINLKKRLAFNKDNMTIAGQTAPGDGITIRQYPTRITGDNIILRYMRFRPGDEAPKAAGNGADGSWDTHDAFEVVGSDNVIVDHISASWSIDETVSVWGATNVTVQNSIISESLFNSFHSKGPHGKGVLVKGAASDSTSDGITFYGNIIAHHSDRNPRATSALNSTPSPQRDLNFDFVNNIIYNWGASQNGAGVIGAGLYAARVNYVNNYAIAGSDSTPISSFLTIRDQVGNLVPIPKIYYAGNLVDNDKVIGLNGESLSFSGTAIPLGQRHPFPEVIKTRSATDAYYWAIRNAGSSLHRDSIDERVLNDLQTISGSTIDSQGDVGGYPTLSTGTPPVDINFNHIPDNLEAVSGNNFERYLNMIAAPVHTQLSVSDNYLAFQAEEGVIVDYDNDGVTWIAELDGNQKLGTLPAVGQVLRANGAGGSGNKEGDVVYNLKFQNTGISTYYLYVRTRNNGERGIADSLYSTAFATEVGQLNTNLIPDKTVSLIPELNIYNEEYRWKKVGAYSVTAGSIQTLRLGIREADTRLDSFIFHETDFGNYPNTTYLNTLVELGGEKTVHTQLSVSDNYLAFQAEEGVIVDYDNDGVTWIAELDGNQKLGTLPAVGQVLRANGAGGSGNKEGDVVYSLKFQNTGISTYYLYVRTRNNGERGIADSLYSTAFATEVGQLNTNLIPDKTVSLIPELNIYNEEYRWKKVGAYSVTAGSIQTLRLGIREADTRLDSFIFHETDFGNYPNTTYSSLFDTLSGVSLHAAGSEITNSNVLTLNNQQLTRATQEATRRWELAGADVSGLRDLTISIGNLGGNLLGQATGNSIVIDGNAAGYGWYVDRNMRTDAEFQRYRKPAGMDLLTVVMHEFGHVLGYDHDDPNDGIATLMDHTLDVGERHSPDGFQSDENIVKDTRKGWWKRFRKSRAGA